MSKKDSVVERIHVDGCDTPLGRVWIAASQSGLRVVTVPGSTREECTGEVVRRAMGAVEFVDGGGLIKQACGELGEYFAGARQRFTVPLDLRGTDFQRAVWDAVCQVPFGETITYQGIARQIGAPTAYRAVGAANGANPVAIIVPCHRIVGTDGKLHGYGGGLRQKQTLLDLEAAHQNAIR